MVMQRNRSSDHYLRLLMAIAAFMQFLTVCNGGEFAETEYFFKFIRSLDPENVLRIKWNEFVPPPCSYHMKGIRCDLRSTSITEIRLDNLNLSGIIDADSLCKLPNLRVLILSRNRIHGNIPGSIANCVSLSRLDLSSNCLNGSVPLALTELKNLRKLEMVDNNIWVFKQQPKESNKFSLEATALQSNLIRKSEEVMNYAATPGYPTNGSKPDQMNEKSYKLWALLIPLILGIILLSVYLIFSKIKAVKLSHEKAIPKAITYSPPHKTPSPDPPKAEAVEEVKPEEKKSELVFFVEEEERFTLEDLLEATADLESQNICSSLYKVKLKNNSIYAVKRLKKLQVSSNEFHRTMRKIGNIKHQNFLPLVACNSTNEESLLIYKYQANGSLLTLFENYIDGKRDFPWKLRLSIAIGIARGLDFIYQGFNDGEVIPHGNIKLSNIMLSENEEPLISEYGYATFVDPRRASLLSCNGYKAPEKSSTEQADVFSFGVILLELLTGKIVEKSGLDLPKWVKSKVSEEWTGEVFDKEVSKVEWYGFPLLNVSLKCVAHFPEERPTIAEVVEKIAEILHAQGDLSPSSLGFIESGTQDCCLLHTVVPETCDTPESYQ